MTTRPRLKFSGAHTSTLQLVLTLATLATAGSPSAATATAQQIDTEQSSITVHVFKAGLFRGLGDNHEIRGPIKSGSIVDRDPAAVHIVIDTQRLRVVDPKASSTDRAQIQVRMLGPEVLDAMRFPEIRFDSETADRAESDTWLVHGRLTLHGQTRPLSVSVTSDRGHYKGSVALKQTDFGIRPISIAGGAVKVKDEVTIEFDIVARAAAHPTE